MLLQNWETHLFLKQNLYKIFWTNIDTIKFKKAFLLYQYNSQVLKETSF